MRQAVHLTRSNLEQFLEEDSGHKAHVDPPFQGYLVHLRFRPVQANQVVLMVLAVRALQTLLQRINLSFRSLGTTKGSYLVVRALRPVRVVRLVLCHRVRQTVRVVLHRPAAQLHRVHVHQPDRVVQALQPSLVYLAVLVVRVLLAYRDYLKWYSTSKKKTFAASLKVPGSPGCEGGPRGPGGPGGPAGASQGHCTIFDLR